MTGQKIPNISPPPPKDHLPIQDAELKLKPAQLRARDPFGASGGSILPWKPEPSLAPSLIEPRSDNISKPLGDTFDGCQVGERRARGTRCEIDNTEDVKRREYARSIGELKLSSASPTKAVLRRSAQYRASCPCSPSLWRVLSSRTLRPVAASPGMLHTAEADHPENEHGGHAQVSTAEA
ncbi:hypothetical protein BJV78DRAFT_1152639 [Lactifluus subvellereus]|nr:hypothetical protein BJV78DRAFT_1152639 [Lactifluus subvellereus]